MADEKIVAVSQATTYTGAVTGVVVGGLSLSELIALGSFTVALIALIVTWVYKQKNFHIAKLREERETEITEAAVERLARRVESSALRKQLREQSEE